MKKSAFRRVPVLDKFQHGRDERNDHDSKDNRCEMVTYERKIAEVKTA